MNDQDKRTQESITDQKQEAEASQSAQDRAFAKASSFFSKLGVTTHVRGTETRPVIEFKDKLTRKIVGGREIKQRIRNAVLRDKRKSDR